MTGAADIGAVPLDQRTQSPRDLFLIFAGANIVATTLVTGASLASFGTLASFGLIAVGTIVGSALVASLAPIGPRLGVPSVIAARAALGHAGAAALAALLYVTNFAWIALNNVIAGSVTASVAGGDERAWGLLLGLAATAVVAAGPRAVLRADRVAVPLMAASGLVLLWRCLQVPDAIHPASATSGLALLRGLDVVVAYQVSWILMFADYSRYTASASRGAVAVFLGLALTSLWFMPVGLIAAQAAGSGDPGSMLAALGVAAWGALLVALGTVTTNFVNIYLSALAWRSLVPRASAAATVWSIGGIGAVLGLFSRAWLDRYAELMLVLGGLLVPVGGILLARFFWVRVPIDVGGLYGPDEGGSAPLVRAAAVAWIAGAATYFAAGSYGGTLPSLAVAAVSYRLLAPAPS